MKVKLFFCLAVVLGLAPRTPFQPETDDSLKAKLDRKVDGYDLGNCTMPEALVRASNEFQIPMGIALVEDEQLLSKMPFAWKHATVRQVIEAIVGARAGYHMQIGDGIVHVYAEGRVRDEENFLVRKVANYDVRGQDVELASFKLHNILTPPKFAGYSVASSGDSTATVKKVDSTVADILDELVASSNRKIWIVLFLNYSGSTPSGFRRTKSLFTAAPISDKEQPTWAFLRWGDPVPPLLK